MAPATPLKVLNRVGILLKENDPFSREVFQRLVPLFAEFKSSIRFCGEKAGLKNLATPKFIRQMNPEAMAEYVDLLLIVGGDGSVLRAARYLLAEKAWKHCHLLGINAGHTGFLSLVSLLDLESHLLNIFQKPASHLVEVRSCLDVEITRRNSAKKHLFRALNDCVLSKGTLSRLFESHVELDGEFLTSYRSDGLIVSTPTGSTAYNLAAGGSIMEPSIEALQLTPICAQSLSNKPIVISDRKRIQLQLGRHSSDVYLTVDGHTGREVNDEDRIEIRRSTKSIRFLVPAALSASHYYHSLRQKLKWGANLASPRRP
jgi:NAD+ kinase